MGLIDLLNAEESICESNELLDSGSETEVLSSSASAAFFDQNFPSLPYCSQIISYKVNHDIKKTRSDVSCINHALCSIKEL